MAVKIWKGGAKAIVGRWSVTYSAYTSGVTYRLVINGKSVEFTATASTQANVTDGLVAAVQASAEPEFGEIVATNASNVLTIETAVAGTDVTFTASTDGVPTAAITELVAPTGPNHFLNTENWVGGVLPVSTDSLEFSNSEYDCLYELENVGILVVGVSIDSTYSGAIGLPVQNPAGYREYRPRFLKLGDGSVPVELTVGLGDGRQPSRVFYDASGGRVTARVYGTGNGFGDELPVIVKNTGDSSAVDVYAGAVHLDADSAGTVSVLRITPAEQQSNVSVLVDEAVTLGSIVQNGGSLECRGNASSCVCEGGTSRFVLDALCPTIEVGSGGIVYWESTQSVSTKVTVRDQGSIDFSRNAKSKSVLAGVMHSGSTWFDPLGAVQIPGGILVSGCGLEDINLDVGQGKTLSTSILASGTAVLKEEKADLDLTAFVAVLTHVPDPSAARTCRCVVTLGDGSKDLDGSGGIFLVKIYIGGVLWNGEADEIAIGTVTRVVLQTNNFIVPANEEVIVQIKSPNSADDDVDVTAVLVSE